MASSTKDNRSANEKLRQVCAQIYISATRDHGETHENAAGTIFEALVFAYNEGKKGTTTAIGEINSRMKLVGGLYAAVLEAVLNTFNADNKFELNFKCDKKDLKKMAEETREWQAEKREKEAVGEIWGALSGSGHPSLALKTEAMEKWNSKVPKE
jgi:hypothetical protein